MTHIDTSDICDTWDSSDTTDEDPVYQLRKQNRTRRQPGAGKQRITFGSANPQSRPPARPVMRRQRPGRAEEFRCRHCRAFVVAVPSGGRHRNHCPFCLHSRHVDDRLPGDRLSTCGGTMAPLGAFVRPGGEHAIVHRCFTCGIERHNRVAADDDFALVLTLPDLTYRLSTRKAAIELAGGVTA